MSIRTDFEGDGVYLLDSLKPPTSTVHANIQSRGFREFLFQHFGTIILPLLGLSVCMTAFFFTWWFSRQVAFCPDWANDCVVTPTMLYFLANFSIVQGVVTTVHSIGLAIQATAAYTLASIMLWPILHRRTHQLGDIDIYLQAARGSWMPMGIATLKFRRSGGLRILPYVLIVTGLITLNATIVSFSYRTRSIAMPYHSSYTSGGGIGTAFRQENPPKAIADGVAKAFAKYTSWSQKLSKEPLPDYRAFFIDREVLLPRGNISADALYFTQDIQCSKYAVNITGETPTTLTVATNLSEDEHSVLLRLQTRLTVWIDQIKDINVSRSVTTLVFAAVNGSIEGGKVVPATKSMLKYNYPKGISAIACDVDINLVDSHIQIGQPGPSGPSKLSSLAALRGPGKPRSKFGAKGDIARWLGVAPAFMGLYADGAQPMFSYRDNAMFIQYTTTVTDKGDEAFVWPIEKIKNFTRISSGALATAMQGHYVTTDNVIHSEYNIDKLDPNRAYILLAPSGILWLMIFALAGTAICTYRTEHIPVVYTTDVSEIVALTQTTDIATAAKSCAHKSDKTKHLGPMKVRYGISETGIVGLWRPENVAAA